MAFTGVRRQQIAHDLADRISALIRATSAKPGTHLRAQDLADRFQVSRFPVTEALKLLQARGLVRHEPNRGFFVTEVTPVQGDPAKPDERLVGDAYMRLAEDHLDGRLPDRVSGSFLRERYALSRGQLSELLSRIVSEGWAQRRPGYGWSLSPVLRTPEALQQTYRVRLAIEPAGLIEPGFHLPLKTLKHCQQVERSLLAGAIETMSVQELYETGVEFHETLMEASGNPFFLETLRRVNQVRRLLAYRAMVDRRRYYGQSREHLGILECLERGDNAAAAVAMRMHLTSVIANLGKLRGTLAISNESRARLPLD
ncbi:GntR family transcriptional regulator [Bosea sp. 117]|uniref:GntR family transcriptional regulator n=1 Tax=Bosea sp. 117 TaxID=1125973 RepID=UPI00068B6E1C|nr:GntR family transcriptional regulator [Bosea sp. 117]